MLSSLQTEWNTTAMSDRKEPQGKFSTSWYSFVLVNITKIALICAKDKEMLSSLKPEWNTTAMADRKESQSKFSTSW